MANVNGFSDSMPNLGSERRSERDLESHAGFALTLTNPLIDETFAIGAKSSLTSEQICSAISWGDFLSLLAREWHGSAMSP